MIVNEKGLHLISYGNGDKFDKGKFLPIRNQDFFKPLGGLWASPVNSPYGWKHWTLDNDFHTGALEQYFEFRLKGHVYKINNTQDAARLTWRKLHVVMEAIDYEAMLRSGIDAIWLTNNGERETRFSIEHSLYGWDCESVLVMNPDAIY